MNKYFKNINISKIILLNTVEKKKRQIEIKTTNNTSWILLQLDTGIKEYKDVFITHTTTKENIVKKTFFIFCLNHQNRRILTFFKFDISNCRTALNGHTFP